MVVYFEFTVKFT